VVFWGNLDFPPNWTAVRYFYEQVFRPHLVDKDVRLHIVGRGGDGHLAAVFRDPRVTRHGFVDDLYELLGRHALMVNPMVQGGGMKNKVLEAFACGIPVVSTGLGLDGIDAQAGIHCQVADDPATFARLALGLLDDPELSRRQAYAARQLVEEHYTWARSAAQLGKIITEMADECSARVGHSPADATSRASETITREAR
jgi:glycosyltransferase involved in cell wall biosynthesis